MNTNTYQRDTHGQMLRASSFWINSCVDACGFDFQELRKPPYINLKAFRAMCQATLQMGHRILSHIYTSYVLPTARELCDAQLESSTSAKRPKIIEQDF